MLRALIKKKKKKTPRTIWENWQLLIWRLTRADVTQIGTDFVVEW